MQKIVYFRRVHGSYVLAGFLVGILVGVVFAMGFRWNFFGSFWWILVVLILISGALVFPTYAFLVLGFVAGMILGFFRVAIYLQSGEGGDAEVWTWVANLQSWFSGRIQAALPSPEAELGISYLLGVKDGLPEDLIAAIRAVGLAHIIVASGAHLSILTGAVRKVFGRASRFFGAAVALIFIVVFMAMIGWTPSILRAGIIAILTILFGYYGRKFAAWRIILIAMVFTLMVDPSFLTDLGWQLSFASYFGILILAPKIERYFYGGAKVKFLPRTIIATVAATLATLPLTLYYFGSVSLILILANVLILPTLPYAMGLTFFAGIFDEVPGVGFLVSWLTTKLLDFHILVVNFLAAQEYFIVEIPERNWLMFFGYVPILAFLIWNWFRNNREKGRPKKFLPESRRRNLNPQNRLNYKDYSRVPSENAKEN